MSEGDNVQRKARVHPRTSRKQLFNRADHPLAEVPAAKFEYSSSMAAASRAARSMRYTSSPRVWLNFAASRLRYEFRIEMPVGERRGRLHCQLAPPKPGYLRGTAGKPPVEVDGLLRGNVVQLQHKLELPVLLCAKGCRKSHHGKEERSPLANKAHYAPLIEPHVLSAVLRGVQAKTLQCRGGRRHPPRRRTGTNHADRPARRNGCRLLCDRRGFRGPRRDGGLPE